MVTVTQDPINPDRLALTATVTVYIDRLLDNVLSDEVARAIKTQAIADLTGNDEVKQRIAAAATRRLLTMLGESKTAGEKDDSSSPK